MTNRVQTKSPSTAQACLLDGADAQSYAHNGHLLLGSGEFVRAEAALQSCLALQPDHYGALVDLSGLLYNRGDYAGARAILERWVAAYPLLPHVLGDAGKPGLVRVLGFSNSAFHIIGDPTGQCSSAVHGGHFAPDHLIDVNDWDYSILNLSGHSAPVALPQDTRGVLNTISDPDRERATLLELALLLDRHPGIPVMNDPRRILETTRERNAARLGSIPGLRIARTERLRWQDGSVEDAIREVAGLGFRLPVILRKTGSQTGDDTMLARSEGEMQQYFAAASGTGEHYAIQYHDLRCKNGLYHKTRVFFIDGRMYPVANLYHDTWSVHSGDRYAVMSQQDWTQQEERAFLTDPQAMLGKKACDILARVSEIVQLDYFGIDFTLCDDGGVFVFEANASMRHNFDHASAFPYTRPALETISAAFTAMVRRRVGDL